MKTIHNFINYRRDRIGIEKHLASIRFPVRQTKKIKRGPDESDADKAASGASKVQVSFTSLKGVSFAVLP